MSLRIPAAAALALLCQVPAAAHPEPAATQAAHRSAGSVTVGGKRIAYRAEAGTIPITAAKSGTPGMAMSYVAYFAKGAAHAQRPVLFLFNGGPGASSLWLQMAAFGPRRIVTDGTAHTAAPYRIVSNPSSLLDVSDLVFVDSPGTGFGTPLSAADGKAFYGIDQDARAFATFVPKFLTRYGRWNARKYILGESYGALRGAVLVNQLQAEQNVDIDGLILLSPILSYNLSANLLDLDPGNDHAYAAILPSYAATAWYHDRLPGGRPADLDAFLAEVEAFAAGDYARALFAGGALAPDRRQAIAERLARYTGLTVADILAANLRVTPELFQTRLLANRGLTVSRLDTRFTGPSIDPLAKTVAYDPQAAATTAAFLAGYNAYARSALGYAAGDDYRIDASADWDWSHKAPGASRAIPWIVNAMPDLAAAMTYNPDLKVSVHTGLFDFSTPFGESRYEMDHLPIPDDLRRNVAITSYRSGHQIYLEQDALAQLHRNIAAFVAAPEATKPR